MHWPAPHAIDGISCGCAALLSRPTLQKNPWPSGSAVRAAMPNALRTLHVVPPSVDEVSMMRGLPPELQDNGAPVAGFAHSWKTTKSVPFAAAAPGGDPFAGGGRFFSDACRAAGVVEAPLILPRALGATGAALRIG